MSSEPRDGGEEGIRFVFGSLMPLSGKGTKTRSDAAGFGNPCVLPIVLFRSSLYLFRREVSHAHSI
jgi:hypothetical protein